MKHSGCVHLYPTTMAYDDHSSFQLARRGIYVSLGIQDMRWTDKGLEPVDPGKPIPFNRSTHYHVNDDVLRTGVRLYANVATSFPSGCI